jgi:hypothetical protein
MKQKKYELTKERVFGKNLFRIKALIDFNFVKKGELGGFIEKEGNLSQDGNAWVFGDARVSGNAWVSGDARVSGNAWVFGDAQVFGNARVSGDAQVSGKIKLNLGFYFGMQYKKEKINKLKTEDGSYILWKS